MFTRRPRPENEDATECKKRSFLSLIKLSIIDEKFFCDKKERNEIRVGDAKVKDSK